MAFETCTDWWMSTKSPVRMFRPAYQTPELEAYLRSAPDVDPALLALDTGVGRGHIEACQRRLGLRKITGGYRKGRPKV